MNKIVVIGGGMAGLSAAVFLTSKKNPVTLLEASHSLGGRTISYAENSGSLYDNGQHIMMGCYHETFNFLRTINAVDNFYIQKDLEIIFQRSGEYFPLKADRGLYPFNLIKGLFSFRLITLEERFSLLRFFIQLPFSSERDIQKLNAEEWLIQNKQSDNLRKIFWNTLIIGAMNTSPVNASAVLLRNILLKIFFSGRKASALVIPAKPLSEAFCVPAAVYLQNNKSEVCLNERVVRLETDRKKNRVIGIITNKRVITDPGNIISAVPLYVLNKILPGAVSRDFKMSYSPILTMHFRTRTELFPHLFIATTDSPVHWIFKHPGHYTIVISSAGELINLSINALENLLKVELVKLFKIDMNSIEVIKVIKEKRATFIPAIDPESRPGPESNFKNLFLAGDWINTKLPSTIEGAVLSGSASAEMMNPNII